MAGRRLSTSSSVPLSTRVSRIQDSVLSPGHRKGDHKDRAVSNNYHLPNVFYMPGTMPALHSSMHAFIHPFSPNLLGAYYVSGTVPGAVGMQSVRQLNSLLS